MKMTEAVVVESPAASPATAEGKALPLAIAEAWWVAKCSVDMTAGACCHCLGYDPHSFQGGFCQC